MVYGGKLSFSVLDSFLKTSFHLTEKKADAQPSSPEDKKSAEISFIQTTKDLETTCTKKKLCIIGFFDIHPNLELISKVYLRLLFIHIVKMSIRI